MMTPAHVMVTEAATVADSPLPLVIGIVITALASATVTALTVKARSRRRLAQVHQEHRAELAAREAAAIDERARLQRQEAMSTNALEAERLARGHDVDALLGHLSRGMKWERASREIILREASRLGVDGVLATNIVLLTDDGKGSPFVTQIDHVLLTRDTIILIEAKHWRGVVFDEIDPASLHPALVPISRAAGLPLPPTANGPASFAIQLRGDEKTPLTLDRRESPRLQARAQTTHLSRALRVASAKVPWIQSCVFYSHPGVRLFANPPQAGSGRVQTPAVDAASLGSFLRTALRGPGRTPSDVRTLVESLRTHASDLVGLGTMSDEWPDVLRGALVAARVGDATDASTDRE